MSKKSVKKTNLVSIEEAKPADMRKNKVQILPRNLAQEAYCLELANPQKRIVVATGPAGTGKSMMAVLQAIKEYKEGSISKIIITRPTVPVENEKLGFLPGTLEEKMEPWTKPIFDIFEEYYNPKQVLNMIENKIIEICPLCFMRGRTFKDSIIIADEIQNSTSEQVLMLLTRIGEGSRVFMAGDVRQTDIKNVNGLKDFLNRAKNSKSIAICEFTNKDVVRDPIVSEVLKLYGED